MTRATPVEAEAAERKSVSSLTCRELIEAPDRCNEHYARGAEGSFRRLSEAEGTDEMWDRVHVCRDPGGEIAAARYQLHTPSGDWTLDGHYCFRREGTLSYYEEVYNTFYGGVTVRERHEFDDAGQEVRATREIRDLQTNEIVKHRSYGRFFQTPVHRTRQDLQRLLSSPDPQVHR